MGSKASKHNLTSPEPLNREIIKELCQETGFSEDELLAWHTSFYADCPNGRLTLKQFEQRYAKMMGKPSAKILSYVRHMFGVYDQDKDQSIDFKEFVIALSAASAANRLRLIETLYHVFDLDNDGKITKEEIGKMLHTLVDVTNSNKKFHHHSNSHEKTKQTNLQQRIDEAFNELNANDDDYITKDEFIDWYVRSGLLSDVQSNELDISDPPNIQRMEKESRRLIKETIHTKANNKRDENREHNAHHVRYMSKMTERKTPSTYNDVDNDNRNSTTLSSMNSYDNHNIDNKGILDNTAIHVTTNSYQLDSRYPKANRRWEHLFKAVVEEMRVRRPGDQRIDSNEINHLNSWKHEAGENLGLEYIGRGKNGEENLAYSTTTINIVQPSGPEIAHPEALPDIIATRF